MELNSRYSAEAGCATPGRVSDATRSVVGMSDIQNSDAAVEPATPSITQNDSPAETGAAGGEAETLGAPRPDGDDSSAAKDPEDWVTGDEPMTGPQKSYLDTLAREAGEELPATLTKAEASEHINRLQKVTGRGQ